MDVLNPKQFVRDLIEAEFASGFAFARRIPSTETWQTLAYFDALDAGERDVLCDILAERGSAGIGSAYSPERQQELVRHPAYQRYTSGRMQASAWKYADPSFLRSILDGYRRVPEGQGAPPPRPDFGRPLEEVENAVPPVTAPAPDIRREFKRAFGERFRVRPAKLGAGTWNYPGEYDGRPFTLSLDFGGSFHKLRYGVCPGESAPGKSVVGMTWEGMLGLGLGHWNFVCQHNLEASVALLGDIVEKVVLMLEEIRRTWPA
jgi:hypothetical protein